MISLAIPRPLRSGIHLPINFSKQIDDSVYFQQQQKMQNWREEKGHFSFLNFPSFVIIFCQVLKMEIFFFISLAIPRPSRSGIHWPINFSKKNDVSVYFQQQQKKVTSLYRDIHPGDSWIYSLLEAWSEHKVCFWAFLRLTNSFGIQNHLKKCDEHPPPRHSERRFFLRRHHFTCREKKRKKYLENFFAR